MNDSILSRRAACLGIIGCAISNAQVAPGPAVTNALTNGRLWIEFGSAHAAKAAFLAGCQDGLFFGSIIVGTTLGSKDYESVPELLKFPDLTRDEIIKELDLFYSEGANGPVPIVQALYYVRRKGKGDSQAQLQELISSLRRSSSTESKPGVK